jgi:hypothetical protein
MCIGRSNSNSTETAFEGSSGDPVCCLVLFLPSSGATALAVENQKRILLHCSEFKKRMTLVLARFTCSVADHFSPSCIDQVHSNLSCNYFCNGHERGAVLYLQYA